MPSWAGAESERALMAEWVAKGVPPMGGAYPFSDMVGVNYHDPRY